MAAVNPAADQPARWDKEALAPAKAVLKVRCGMTGVPAHRWLLQASADLALPLPEVFQAVTDGTLLSGLEPRWRGPRAWAATGELRAEIADATRAPGSRVTAAEVRSALGVSRRSGRKLMRQLAAEALPLGPQRGYRVAGGRQ